MVFIISVLAQLIACIDTSDIDRKAYRAADFLFHKVLWKFFKTVTSIHFMDMDKAGKQ